MLTYAVGKKCIENVTAFRPMIAVLWVIICTQQTSISSSVLLQMPRNFHQILQDESQLRSNNVYNITGSRIDSNNDWNNNSNHHNNNNNKNRNNEGINRTADRKKNIDRKFIGHINITCKTNFSATLEKNLETIENHTKHFESLSIVDLERNNDNTDIQSIDSQPIFDFGMPRNITGRTGQSEAVIKCRVDMLNDKSVSWIRKRDLHILTVSTTIYTTDKRFEVSTTKDEREWILHIKSPQARDSGIYECQVNTEPKISMAFQLNIVEIPADAKAIITGPPDLHFKVGSVIVLQCLVAQPTVKDIGPIYWYRGEQMITPFQQDDNRNYDVGVADSTFLFASSAVKADSYGDGAGDGAGASSTADINNANSYPSTMHDLTNDITLDFTARIAMESQLGDTLKSRLRISNAQTTDTGNYTCQPTTASAASVMVHVINDENPAAMQKSCAPALTSQTAIVTTKIFLCCLTLLLASIAWDTNTPKLKSKVSTGPCAGI